jgi:hypothetical protein
MACHIPKPNAPKATVDLLYCYFTAAGRQSLAIWAEGHAPDSRTTPAMSIGGMAYEGRATRLARCDIPEDNTAVSAA